MSAFRINCLRIYLGQLIPASLYVELKASNLTRQTGLSLPTRWTGAFKLFDSFLFFLCNSSVYCLTAKLDSVSTLARQITLSDERLHLLLRCLLSLPLDLVVSIYVAVLTHAFGIVCALSVHAISSVASSAESVITVVAHTLCKMLEVLVRAVRNRSRLAA